MSRISSFLCAAAICAGGPAGALRAQADACADAVPAGPGVYEGDTSAASPAGSASCGNSGGAGAVFYRFTAPACGVLLARTCGSAYDTVLSLHRGCPAEAANEIACNDDSCGLQAELGAAVAGGETTWLRLAGFQGATGPYVLELTFTAEGEAAGADAVATDVGEIEQRGRLGSEVAFGMSSTICNLGDRPMDWFANPDPRHPFLVFNLYRLKNDRLEQIGQSWVKHGFSASQGSNCGTVCTRFGTAGQYLGPGCSDFYGVATNSRQSRFGPRSEIDPWTGAFTFEGSHLDITDTSLHDPVEHRLRVEDADLDPARNPGALYFAELYVVAHDDIEHTNNLAHKQLTVAGSPGGVWDVHFLAGAARPGTVLSAWAGAELAVLPEEAPLGDGRCYLATKVTQNPDGTWHYEYALFNLDMARAVGRFRVPLARGVTLRDPSFHAVRSHGEGDSNDPWVIARGANEIAWATAPHGSPDASPLRWGTLYNFRFDAAAPPVESRVTIEMFVPGEPARWSAAAKAPSFPAPDVPWFRRGDSDGSGAVEMSDALVAAGFLFLGRGAPRCFDAVDADDSGELDLSDVVAPLTWLFLGGAAPPPPGPYACGVDPTSEEPPLAPCDYDLARC
jgi:hypothetical protein